MPGDLRLTQLARLLGRALSTTEDARNAAARDPRALAAALLEEAAQNDDVVSAASARDYLDDRLTFFGDIVDPATADAIRQDFAQRLKGWE